MLNIFSRSGYQSVGAVFEETACDRYYSIINSVYFNCRKCCRRDVSTLAESSTNAKQGPSRKDSIGLGQAIVIFIAQIILYDKQFETAYSIPQFVFI